MQIDIQWLRENFANFNRQYFDGALPEPRFYIGRSRTQLGSLAYKRELVCNAFTLTLSNYFDQTEYQFRNVLLHEMIHLSIAASGLRDTSSHGVVFRNMMREFNRKGWNISVTTRMAGTPKAYTGSETVIRQYLILALKTRDGRHFLSSVNPKYARSLHQRLKSDPQIASHAWYTTSDRQYEDWAKVRSLRGRVVDAETFRQKTAAMTPLDIKS